MAATDFIVAIELGSSKITGIAGRKNSDGSIHVLACAKEKSSSFIRKGVIYNLDKTAQSLTSIINQLEGALDNSIGKVYIGVSGQSLRTVKNTVSRHLPDEVIISQELVDEIIDENIQIPLIDMDILDVAPQEYKIGNNLQTDPVGVAGNHIEGRFLNIIARSTIKKNLIKCFEQAKIEIADYFIAPIVTADVILMDSEKRLGCALVDFGAETTTISVYKNNILRYLTVLPLGGNSITRDICTLQFEEEEAEEFKINYGNAIDDPGEGEENEIYQLNDETRAIERRQLNEIIEARVEEIIENVWNQILLSGYDDKLSAGIIITGGASNLKNLDEVIKKRTKIEKVKTVRSIRNGVTSSNPDLIKKDGTQNTVLGLLYAGNENCCMQEQKVEEVTKVSSDLFEEDIEIKANNDRIAAERERKKLQEEEKKRLKTLKDEEKKKKSQKPSKWDSILQKMTNTIFTDEEMK